jgi:hypothetical protein
MIFHKFLIKAFLLGFLLYFLLGGFYMAVLTAVGIYILLMVLGHIWRPLALFNVLTPFLLIAYFLYLGYKSIATLYIDDFLYSFMLALILMTAVELVATEVAS